ISMLECLFSESDIIEKKRLLTEKYGMIMTSELEGRVQTMCNWSEVIIERGIERGMEQGIERGIKQGIKQERFHAIERMLKAGATMAQILSYGYTQEEFAEVESGLFENA
ncbi:MAG: hypothetical protein K2N82_05225, partial [Lachnospiraceae bacterium]|nr:hypothetical protein [Lachnospiraceae bacterium]